MKENHNELKELQLNNDQNKQLKANTFKKILDFKEKVGNSRKMKYSCLDIIGIKLCCCFKKCKEMKRVLEIGDKKINFYLDYLEIRKVMQDVEKLKKVVLILIRIIFLLTSLSPEF